MTAAQWALGVLVLVPLLAAALSVLVPTAAKRVLGVLTAVAVGAATVPVVAAVSAGEPVRVELAGYRPSLGIALHADGLSVLFVMLATVVGVIVTGFAAAYPSATGVRRVGGGPCGWVAGHPGFWPLWLACWSGLNAVFVSGDLFNTYVGLELVGLSAVGLVALGGRTAWPAALRYLFVAVLGSLLLLIAVGLVVSATGTLDIGHAAERITADPHTHQPVVLALVLLTVGLCLKLALMPLHRWLIPAHSGAPGAVSPALSALVIKAALFVLLRCWLWLAGPGVIGAEMPTTAMVGVFGWLLAGLGTLALVAGAALAHRQTRLKPLVAYSTVSQVGYWFLMFPVVLFPLSATLDEHGVRLLSTEAVVAGAVAGTVGLALGHGIAKAGLFLAAGFLKDAYGTDEVAGLRGTAKNHPMLLMGMGLSAVGLAGMPISLGFTGKWQLATAAVGAGHYWVLVVIVVGTLLSAGYLLKALGPLLSEPDEESRIDPDADPRPHAPLLPQVGPLLLGALTVLTGFGGVWLTRLLEVGAPW